MSLFKEKYLKEIRAKCVKEFGGDISDKEFNKVVQKIENKIKKDLKEELPKAFWFPMCEMAEKGDIILEIDGKDIGKEIRQLRKKNKKEEEK